MPATLHALKCPTCGGVLEPGGASGPWWLNHEVESWRPEGDVPEYAQCSRCTGWFRRVHGSDPWTPLAK